MPADVPITPCIASAPKWAHRSYCFLWGRFATVFAVTGDVVLVQADVGVGVMPVKASDDALMVAGEAVIAPLAKAFTARLVFQSSRLSLVILASLGTHCS